ncbi:hypothetical protein F3Y22_tig00112343pilonHSYRG00083 [Hibiscus syriacus]|uniref:ABC transmembrane type-1 domain-containing protein n=1 Tax=Hibiscus syriacus TaxID=106335 RepID=A0A6A2X1G3_HIBSY|nr:hypothetical protein F3Y22_tig00112343pilonHSYRG00083 [Hibiscus syriacus]
MANLRKALYSVVLCNKVAWFEKPENNVGSLTSRVINDTSIVKTIISNWMSVIVQCISSILIATVVIMVINWRMGLAKSAKGFAGDSAAIHRKVVALASESAANIRTIASFCHEEHSNDDKRVSKMASDRTRFPPLTVPSITELWTLIPSVISAINVLTPAFETLDCKTKIEPEKPKDSARERIKGKIEFENVKFNYPLRPEVTVLDNFSLRIEPGTKVALVGPSGAGKSSVLAILLVFYVPLEGRVLIDDKNIK